MSGLVAWGAYVPYNRLKREAIGQALRTSAGKGTRAVASFDEDATSMAVEAARGVPGLEDLRPRSLVFATASPPYLDKTNATAVHAALLLPAETSAYDFNGSVRSAFGALDAAQGWAQSGGDVLLAVADVRTGLPGGVDERDGGDGAAAFVVGTRDVAVEIVAAGHATEEFLDRWRVPTNGHSGTWEERFGEHAYVPLGEAAIAAALKEAGLTPSELDHVVVAGTHTRAVRRLTASLGARPEALAPDLVNVVGNCGAAHWGLALCDVLDRATPGQTILVVSLADGADALVLRTTEALTAAQQRVSAARTVAAQIAAGRDDLDYTTFLTWRGFLHREPPRRPDPEPPAGPPSLRAEGWKFGLVGSRCNACATRHLPPARVCVSCHAIDDMTTEAMAGIEAKVATYTIDQLAYSLSPPTIAAVIDLDGGGRLNVELTDMEPSEVHIGLRVQMTFRRLNTARGVHNYFWKAKPVRSA